MMIQGESMRGRKVLKYSAAGAVTALYAGSAVQATRQPAGPPADWRKLTIACVIMIGLTWIATTA